MKDGSYVFVSHSKASDESIERAASGHPITRRRRDLSIAALGGGRQPRKSADPRKWIVLELIERALATKCGPQDDLGRTVVNLADQSGTRRDRQQSFQCFLRGLRRDDCDESTFARQIQRIETQ